MRRRWLVLLITLLAIGCTAPSEPEPDASASRPESAPVAQVAPTRADEKLLEAILKGTGYPSEWTRQQIIELRVREMFAREDYAGLEKLAERLRSRPPEPVVANYSPLAVFYEGITDGRKIPYRWGGAAYRYRRWLQKFPDSDVARNGYCRLLTTGALIRKSHPDDRSTVDLGATEQIGEEVDLLVSEIKRKDAQLVDTKLLIGAAKDNRGSQLELAEGMFAEAHEREPDNTEPYSFMGSYLAIQRLPRNQWCARLAERPEDYAQAFMTTKLAYDNVASPFIYKEFLYPELLPALRELQKKRPDSLYIANTIAWIAGLKEDYQTARIELEKIGRSLDPDVFKSTADFMKLRSRAGVSDPDGTLPTVVAVTWEKDFFPAPNEAHVLPYHWVCLLRQHRFLELESLAAACTPEVQYDLYASLGKFQLDTKSEQEARRDDLEAWVAERPKSPQAQLALAQYWLHMGWEARGGGYADTVSRQANKLFQDRLDKAEKAVDKAADLESKDLALWLTRISLYQGKGDPQRIRAAAQEAAEAYPDRLEPYTFMVLPCLPRWYGEPGDLRKLSEEAVRKTRKVLGQGAAAAIGLEAMDSEGIELVASSTPGHLDWRAIVQGMADLEARGRAMTRQRNQFAYRAVLLKDRAAATRALKALKPSEIDLSLWGTGERFEAARAWAQGTGPWREAPPEVEVLRAGLMNPKTGELTNDRVIPCKKGSQIWIEYRVKGNPVRPVSTISTWSFPRMKHPQQGALTQLQQQKTFFPDHLALPQTDGYILEYPYELVEGDWEWQLTDMRGNPLARAQFQVK